MLMFPKCLQKVTENALPQFECIAEPCDAKNSWYAEKFQACVTLLWGNHKTIKYNTNTPDNLQ